MAGEGAGLSLCWMFLDFQTVWCQKMTSLISGMRRLNSTGRKSMLSWTGKGNPHMISCAGIFEY